ncbi:hypothetical protein Tco_1165896 [Tanacetum coccineum]
MPEGHRLWPSVVDIHHNPRFSLFLHIPGKFTLSPLDVLQGFSFFLQMGFTLILATLDGLDVGLLGDVIGEDDSDDNG